MITKMPAMLLALSIAALAGCSQQTINSAQNDASHDLAVVKPQLNKLGLGAQVTTALTAAGIHGVRVDADTNGVSLHGQVNSADQKARAGRIAQDTLGSGKSVNNQLQVGG